MAYYLSEFTGDGTQLDPFRPPVAGQFGIIDLRGDSTALAGRCLLWTPTDLPNDSRYEKVADATVESIPRNIARRIENVLGVSLTQFDTLQAIIAELLILHGSFTDPGRWKPLQANRFGRHVIHLGGKVYDAPAPVGSIITDDFNRADGEIGSSSEGWSWTEIEGDIDIVSNEAKANTSGWIRAESDLASVDHYAQMLITFRPDSESYDGMTVRFSSSALTGYYGRRKPTVSTWEIMKVEAGSQTSLIESGNTTEPTPPYTLYLEVDGSSLDLREGTTSRLTTTDTAITGGTRTGFRLTSSTAVDNFEAGDLGATFPAAPPNLTATAVSATQVDLTWDAVSGTTGYDVRRGGVIIATDVGVTSYSDTSPDGSTLYEVRAVDS